MSNVVLSTINQAKDGVVFAASSSANAVTNSVKWCGRTFEDLTNKAFGEVGGRIVQRIAYGLPFAALQLTLPAYLQVAALVSFAMARIIHGVAEKADASLLSQGTYTNIRTGIATGFLVRAANHVVKLATQQRISPILLLVDLAAAAYFAPRPEKAPVATPEQATPSTPQSKEV